MGSNKYEVKNIIVDDGAAFSKVKAHNLPDGQNIYFNIKKPVRPFPYAFETTQKTPTSTIPTHLIPLGPDANPLINPDGTYIAPALNGLSQKDEHLSLIHI